MIQTWMVLFMLCILKLSSIMVKAKFEKAKVSLMKKLSGDSKNG